MKKWLIIAALVLVGALLLIKKITNPEKELPVYAMVPKFELTDQQGKAFSSEKLKGKTWVAGFIFTRCVGQCPIITDKMKTLRNLPKDNSEFALVSFSVDPTYDTPDKLKAYAKKQGAEADNWFFLSGRPGQVEEISRKGFFLSADGQEAITHAFRLVLVDKTGQIRGYYNPEDQIDQLAHDLRRL